MDVMDKSFIQPMHFGGGGFPPPCRVMAASWSRPQTGFKLLEHSMAPLIEWVWGAAEPKLHPSPHSIPPLYICYIQRERDGATLSFMGLFWKH